MPHATVKFLPGANTNETPALNQAGISDCNLVRYIYDSQLGALVEKLGGWIKFFPQTMAAIVRALWAWEDTEGVTHLAVGTQNISTSAQLSVITNGVQTIITPRATVDNITAAVSTTAGNSIVTITDTTTTNVTQFDTVYIATQISVGGLILFGLYACNPDGFAGSTTYHIQAMNVLGNPLPAPSSSTSPTLPEFTTTSGLPTVTVTLANHGYAVGSTFPVLVPTTVGGIQFYGNYLVQLVTDANNFVIQGGMSASSSTTGFLNGNKVQYIYNIGIGATPTGTGYGIGGYGTGGYGTGTNIVPATGIAIAANDWTLDNWGEILVACPVKTPLALTTGTADMQPIYMWNPESGSPIATIIPQAPPYNDGMFVAMPQRQIIAWGSTFTGVQDPLLVRWCDINNFNAWLANVTNQAGSYRIAKGSRIVGGIQVPQQGLIWTDIGLWSMQYIGQPYVYSFNEIGSGCGLIARKAAASLTGTVYWMGPSSFFTLSGDGVIPLSCPIWDVVFQNLDQANLTKIRVAVNSRFNEIAWYYPSITGGSGEVDSYVKYNALLGTWDFGSLGRTAWVDQSVLGPPVGADPNLYLYQHETSPDADGAAMDSSFTTGYFAMSDADQKIFVDQVWPDMKWGTYSGMPTATVNLTFNVLDYAGGTPKTYGPYPMTKATNFLTPRFRGRLTSLTLGSNDVGSFWRIGAMRYRYAPDGKF